MGLVRGSMLLKVLGLLYFGDESILFSKTLPLRWCDGKQRTGQKEAWPAMEARFDACLFLLGNRRRCSKGHQ